MRPHKRNIPIPPKVKQTTRSGGDFSEKFKAQRDLHARALFSSLDRLVASRFNSIMTIIVLSMAIALASGFYMLVVNLEQLASNLESSNQISLFLRDDISLSTANKLANGIRLDPNVQDVRVISKDEALKEFEQYSGFGEAVRALEKNPLPIVLQVTPRHSLEEGQSAETLLDNFKQAAEVDFAQLDIEWVKRLQSIMDLAHKSVIALSAFLGFAVFSITGNTIRLELYNRREEISVEQLVGATNGFIMRPFLYGGFWIGFFSGMSAWFIITIITLFLKQPIENLSKLYDSNFHVLFLNFSETGALLLISSLLGVVGTGISTRVQLMQLKPE